MLLLRRVTALRHLRPMMSVRFAAAPAVTERLTLHMRVEDESGVSEKAGGEEVRRSNRSSSEGWHHCPMRRAYRERSASECRPHRIKRQ
jgi:hypothetical protein